MSVMLGSYNWNLCDNYKLSLNTSHRYLNELWYSTCVFNRIFIYFYCAHQRLVGTLECSRDCLEAPGRTNQPQGDSCSNRNVHSFAQRTANWEMEAYTQKNKANRDIMVPQQDSLGCLQICSCFQRHESWKKSYSSSSFKPNYLMWQI